VKRRANAEFAESAEDAEERNPRAQPGIIPQKARDGAAVAVPQEAAGMIEARFILK
jgi:hypothetical protein